MAANMHNDYADIKNERKAIEYLHPDLEAVLGDTYGLMVYQESMMRVAQKVAGYTLADADLLRRACGKKNRELIAIERQRFVDGVERSGYERSLGTRLFDIIEPFADYAFNKSHAYGYGLVAFQTAFLKAHYPVEYLACLLHQRQGHAREGGGLHRRVPGDGHPRADPGHQPVGDELRRPVAGRRCRRRSSCRSASPGAILFGLSAVRNVGEGLVEQLLIEREANGPYADFHEFADRVPEPVLNKRAIESLIKAGAFDPLGHTRRGLLGVFEHIVTTTLGRRRERELGVMSLFGDVEESAGERRLRRARAGSRAGVRQDEPAAQREGDARAVRVRPPAVRQGGGAASQGRPVDQRSRGARRPRDRCVSAAWSPGWRGASPSAATRWPRSASRTSRATSRWCCSRGRSPSTVTSSPTTRSWW